MEQNIEQDEKTAVSSADVRIRRSQVVSSSGTVSGNVFRWHRWNQKA